MGMPKEQRRQGYFRQENTVGCLCVINPAATNVQGNVSVVANTALLKYISWATKLRERRSLCRTFRLPFFQGIRPYQTCTCKISFYHS